MTAETLTTPRGAYAARRDLTASADHPMMRLFTFVLVVGAFFLIEHSWDAQARFTEMIGASSPDQLATSEMFQTSSYRQLGAVALGIFGGLVLLFSVRKERAPLAGLGALILFYVLWNGFSLVWADDPGVTLRRFIMFAFLCLGAYGVQAQYTVKQLTWFALLCSGFFLLLGITAEVYNGTFPPGEAGYRFAGTLHPNAQAVNCAIMLLASLSLFFSERRGHLLFIVAILLSAAFLYLTKSRTALAVTGLVMIVYWGLQQSRGVRVALLAALIAGGAGLLILASLAEDKFSAALTLGRTDLGESSTSFTGRVPVWKHAFEYVAERPFLGYGYGGFWNEEHTTDFIERHQWPVPHAHNVYIDVLLEGGPIAALAYLFLLLVGIRRGLALRNRTGNPGYGFLVLVLLFCAFNGLLESIAIQRSLITLLCMMVLVVIAFREPEPDGTPEKA